MNIKELKEYIKNLPDEMEVTTEAYTLIGQGEYTYEGLKKAKIEIDGDIITFL